MDPIITPMLIAAGVSALGKGIGAYGASRQQANAIFGDSQEARLKELERLEEMRALGLTDAEQQQMNRMLLSPVQAAQKEQMLRSQALMGQADSSGKALTSIMRAQEREDQTLERAAQAVAQADMQRARQQEAEIKSLQDRETQAEALKKGAIFNALAGGMVAGGDAFMQAQIYQDMALRGPGAGFSSSDKAFIDWMNQTGGTGKTNW